MSDIQDIDVLILGAGVNGAGTFRDIAEQGLSVVIADKGDFSSGTSAAPSRLIHGGIKYLETGEFRLVAQSTLERNLLLRNAPHVVHPLQTVIPFFSWFKGIPAAIRTLFGSTTAPRSRGAVLMKIGLSLYDFYGAKRRVMPKHSLWSKKRALQEIPPLTPKIVAAGAYYDATVRMPERLVVELLMDGKRANPGAEVLNYTHLTGVQGDVIHLTQADGTARAFRPKIVLNAGGPWIDQVNAQLGLTTKLIGGTKGSHILLAHPGVIAALKGRMIYFEADDGRICLVFDYLGRALVGSSDIRAADPDNVRCEDDEIDYFMQAISSLLPGLSFSKDQIVYAYAGIRPLPASDAANPGLISRDHSAPVQEPEGARTWPVISLVGGKWTTFRGFSEEVADVVLKRLGVARKVSTQDLAIGGGRDYPADPAGWIAQVASETGAGQGRVKTLFSRYGTTARELAKAEGPRPITLSDAPDYSLQELGWITRNEQVVHLEDLVKRRTALSVTGILTDASLEQAAGVAAAALNWDEARRAEEVARTRDGLKSRNRLRLS
ncbi:glycerol-3-phosphate dehydrogenase/oxidase [Pseudogemmobacter hezensis]|uniref:glycerol-3-phosphate dehydrogenase/oxidase n=1 Tax=Pseudogemmobacter hezensis TaxID=2737662 RepID=UPI001C1308D1|nr:glycerol-3-phosphate dehydrogenase/oxidase [Pseudogemmobacter hezensis]